MSFNSTQLGAVKFYGPAILPLSSSSFGTHISQNGIGGFVELPNITSRNTIPIAEEMNSDGVSSGRRKLGMIVYTIEENRFFQLVPLSGEAPVSFADWDVASDAQKMVWLDPVSTREDIYGSSPTFTLVNGSGNPNDCWKELFFNAGLPTVGNFLPLSGGTVTGNLTVDGSFMVNGSATFVNSTNLVIEDPLIFIANNNPANLVDLGIVGQFINSPTQFTGLVRDHQTNEWVLFSGLTGVELTATDLDFTDSSLKIDTLRANLIGDLLSSTKVFGNLSASGDVYGNNLHWNEWDSTWTTVSANSATWGQGVTDLQLLSANWQSTYTTVSSNSAAWSQNVTDLQDLSGSWQSTYTTVETNSSKWETAYNTVSSTILQNGNSFGKAIVIGSNDPYSLTFETSGTPRITILSGGNVGIGNVSPNHALTVSGDISANTIRLTPITTSSAGIQFGTDTNLYRPGANRLKTDDTFECSLPANTTSNIVLVQAAANNAINARTVSPALWTVGNTVSALSAEWTSTYTTVSANSAIWGQSTTDLRYLSGNWQSTYTTVSSNSATWSQGFTLLADLSSNWQSTYLTVSALSADWSDGISEVVIARVFNADSVPFVRGHVVYTFGAQGDTMSVKLASNSSEATSSKTLGVVRDPIPVGDYGYVTLVGSMDKLHLSTSPFEAGVTFSEGDALWLGTVSGSYTNVKPVAPNHGVYLGVVERANNGNGIAYIKVQNGYELNEIHDVLIASLSAGQILRRNSLNNLWQNVDDAFGWDSVLTTVSANSSNWDSAYTSISSAIRQEGNSFGSSVVIGSNDPYSLVFETSGISRITILSGGNVGIGTSIANYPLTVSGDISANAIRLTPSTSNVLGIQFGADTNLYRSAVNTLRTDDSFIPLLNSSTTSDTVVVAQTNTNNTLQKRAINSRVWNTTAVFITGDPSFTLTQNYIPKAVNSSSLKDSQLFDNETNVGIGTTTPNEKLTVVGSISASDYVYQRTKLKFVTTNYSFSAEDQNCMILFNSVVPVSANVPSDAQAALGVGASVNFATLDATVFVTGSPGVTIRAADDRNYLRVTNSTATVMKIGSNEWLLFGDIWGENV